MAMRTTGDERFSYRLGHHREVALDRGPFRHYLRHFSWSRYLRDFFGQTNTGPIVGFVVGVLCWGYGVGRLFVQPGLQSLGVILVGFAVAAFFLMLPLLIDAVVTLACDLVGVGHSGRRHRR